MINPSDLPPIESIVPKPRVVIPQEEIERINELIVGMRRQARQILKDAMEVGDWFAATRIKLNRKFEWSAWCEENFPKVAKSTIWNYQRLAANREFLTAFSQNVDVLSVNEAVRLISQQNRMDKPRVRRIVVDADAEASVVLEAKLKNYVITLWQLRYLQTEIEGMLLAMELKPDQILRILQYVCKEHHEVEEEVLRTFKPNLKMLPKGA